MESGKAENRRTPDPEGPEQIAERVQRRREGFSGRIMRAFWRMTSLEHFSPGRRTVILLVGLAEFGLLGLGFFTELPSAWLITAALAILPLVFHKNEEEESEADPDLDSRSEA